MFTDPTEDTATTALLAELRELCTDVTGGDQVRVRRLAVLRRLERRLGRNDARAMAIA